MRHKRHNQNGFQIVPLLVFIMVMGAVTYTGLHINAVKKVQTEQIPASNAPATSIADMTEASDFRNYTDTALGLSLSYPKIWGSLDIPSDTSLSSYRAVTANATDKIGKATLDGRFGLVLTSQKDFSMSSLDTAIPSINLGSVEIFEFATQTKGTHAVKWSIVTKKGVVIITMPSLHRTITADNPSAEPSSQELAAYKKLGKHITDSIRVM